MKNCYTSMSIHEGNGTSQTERWNAALSTDFFLVDERSEEDLILFVQKLASFVNYYDFNNEIEGNWKIFFENESTTILISIAKWNINLLQKQYETLKKEILITASATAQKNLLKGYFQKIKEEFEKLVEKVAEIDDEIPAKESLIGSYATILDLIELILIDVETTTFSIPQLLQHFAFTKKQQQIFGMLTSWRNFAEASIENQLNNYEKHQPHYALFLSFLKLMKLAQDQLNHFTKNHLDFYYKTILHTQNQNAKPDFVHLVAEPFKVKPFLVPKSTIFPAGKNALGKAKYFASTADVTINTIALSNFCSLHFEGGKFFKVENLVKEIGSGNGFDIFEKNREEFREAILLASPIFFLQSGDRAILLRFNNQNLDASNFDFFITGEKKLIKIENVSTKNKETSEKFIKLTIPNTEKAIVPHDKKLHPEISLETNFPVLKMVPKNNSVLTSISKIDIEVWVNDFKSYVIESDFGGVNPEKPFYPFGEIPKNGNGISISCNEFFMKKNVVANFETDYDSYSKLSGSFKIFQLNESVKNSTADSINAIKNYYPAPDFDFKNVASENKIRIELNNTNYADEIYMQNYINSTSKISQDKTATLPYKPRFTEFTFNYSVKRSIDFSNINFPENQVEIYVQKAFGYEKHDSGTLFFSNFLENQGYFYLGFSGASPKDSLNILVQLEEGTANPLLPPAQIKWEFLSKNSWEEFEEGAMGDETFSLLQSGIISVNLPDFDASKNTVLPPEIFWIRASVSNVRALCHFFGVHAQAFKAVLTDYEKIGSSFTEITPKETISKSLKAINGIKKISQPYASFDGRIAEKDENLYQRTSERLRHKNLAITSWDYEHILLQEFPEIYRVKTLNHFRFDTEVSNVSAGYVSIIPIAKSAQNENINWKPLLSLNKMQKVKEFLEKICSPQARLCVKPPKPERVELNFKVKFFEKPGVDSRIYKQQLMQTINEFLSPWAFDLEQANFAQNIEFSTMIKLIDNQVFVDYIADFSVKQYLLDENYNAVGTEIKNLTKITPQTDFTLFIPTETHQIQEI